MNHLDIGLHDRIPAARYHADMLCERPTLSSSIAKILLGSTPRHAWWAHPRLNPNFEPTDDSRFDLGTVAHELFLGRGSGYEVVFEDDWRSKAAKAEREKARGEGMTPILHHQFEAATSIVRAISDRLISIPSTAGVPWGAHTERVAIWEDEAALCRAMIDVHGPNDGDIWDVKTTSNNLSDDSLVRLIDNLGYDLSAAFYIRGLTALLPHLAGRFRFRWIWVQDIPPHEVRVVEASPAMLELGDRKAALAIAKWKRCLAADDWPGYPPTVARLDPAPWAIDRQTARELTDDDALDMRPLSRAGVQGAPELLGPL